MFRRKAVELPPPEWMFVGLGNPGPEYVNTRHNVGFLAIDELASAYKIKLVKSRHRSLYAVGQLGSSTILLVKPLTFMNLSGQAVAPLARQFGLVPAKIIVIADDVALRVGRVRFKPKGGPGGHNGHKSLIQALGTNEYPRIKIGVGVPEDDLVEHVLGKFNLEEQQRIKEAMKLVVLGCERVCKEGLEPAISAVNTLSEQ